MKYLCIDLGEKRVGIALSDNKGIIAQPHSIINRTSDKQVVDEISDIVEEKNIGEIVIGIPYSADEDTQNRFRSFAQKVSEITGLTVHEWDETLSTKQAQNMVAFSGHQLPRKKTQDHRDAVAAAVILQEFLDYEKRKSA